MPIESSDQRAFRKISIFAKTRGETRRILILRSAIEVLSSQGIQHTTFDAVARVAKMQRSHVAYYFKTRDEMVLMAIRFVVVKGQEATIELLKDAKTPEKRLMAILRAFFQQAKDTPQHIPIWILFWSLASIDPTYRLLQEEIKQMGKDRIEQILELYFNNSKTTRKEISLLARNIQALGYGYMIRAMSSKNLEEFEECADEVCKVALALMQKAKDG